MRTRATIKTRAVAMLGVLGLAACTNVGPTATTVPTSEADPTKGPTQFSPLPISIPPPSDPFASQTLEPQVEVTCGPDAPRLRTLRVEASADGVRFVVTGEPGWILMVETVGAGAESTILETTPQVVALLIAPNDVLVSCSSPERTGSAPTTSLRIEDPGGVYRSPEITVGGACVIGSNSFEEGAIGSAGSPIDLVPDEISGLAPGDILERAGYPVEQGRVRVVRAGRVIGSITFAPDLQGGWLLSDWQLCEGLGKAS